MDRIGKNLLKEVKNAIQLRNEEPEAYALAFSVANKFITATINAKLEFVPLELLSIHKSRVLVDVEVGYVFGEPEQRGDLDDLLIKFYAEHNLSRTIDGLSVSAEYFLKPIPPALVNKSDDFFDADVITKLSTYAGKKYVASDPFLKDLGAQYAEHIMKPTNRWGEYVVSDGYILETERYWQVAGNFKTFTWAKLYKKEYQNHHIFFSVGVDVANQSLVIKLDCLRSGTHKLSNGDIRKFDYFTANYDCLHTISLNYFDLLNWDIITKTAKSIIDLLEPVYVEVVEYIFNDNCDLHDQQGKIFPMSSKYRSDGTVEGEIVETNSLVDLVIQLEQFTLDHAGKSQLLDQVNPSESGMYTVDSFELDGTSKEIIICGTTGGSSASFQLTAEQVSALSKKEHTYL